MALPTDWISAAGVSAAAVTKMQSGLMTSLAYTAPPTAAQNASQVRNELSTELARIDATISSRSSQSSVDAIKAKTDALPADFTAATFSSPGVFAEAALINAPVGGGGGGGGDAPTAEENAAAVRVELAPELTLIGKLDVGEPEQPVIPIPAPPNDPENCLLYLDADQANVKVIVTLSDYPAAGNRLLTSKPVVGVTDSDGHLELTLKRTDRIEPAGLTYHIKSDALGINQEGVTLTADLVDLRDLIPELQ